MNKPPTIIDIPTPSLRQMQNYIREKQPLEIKLVTGDVLSGSLFWQDVDCLCLNGADGRNITIWKQAIAYIQPQS
ncbi:MAG: RNA-binding protein hfq [Synechococcales cyanobacterium CRU_2_2]|nr:RNA-binding protein hfq [Synechococcales cyanobacterium CRU_2_2]